MQHKSIPYFAPHTLYQSFVVPSLPCILFGTSIPHVEFTVSLQRTCLNVKIYREREICPYANINAHKHYIIISTIINVYNGFYLHIELNTYTCTCNPKVILSNPNPVDFIFVQRHLPPSRRQQAVAICDLWSLRQNAWSGGELLEGPKGVIQDPWSSGC